MSDHVTSRDVGADVGAADGMLDGIAAAVLGRVEADEPGSLALVGRAARAERITGDLLQQAVDSARAGGATWQDVGDELGMSRQAAHKRFGGQPDDVDGPDERLIGPVTAFDEMRELRLAGEAGWRTVGCGFLNHRVVRTDTQWEHRRVVWPAGSPDPDSDWEVACRAFPWVYLVRDTGRPVPS